MESEKGWRSVNSPGLPPGSEVNEITGDFRVRGEGSTDDDGLSGDREPRNPKIPPTAGAMALELSQSDENA